MSSKKQQRRLVQSHLDLNPHHAEIRFSTRKATKLSNYKEDDDDMFNEEADMLTPNYHAVGPDENVPAIDAVLNHRLREGIGESLMYWLACIQTYTCVRKGQYRSGKRGLRVLRK